MAITISGSGITSANIADGTITNADINASAGIDGSKLSGLSFGASLTSNQDIAHNTVTKVLFTENFDSDGAFTSSTFTPAVAGQYQINTYLRYGDGTGENLVEIRLYKNGSMLNLSTGWYQSASGTGTVVLSRVVEANTTDYFEVYTKHKRGNPTMLDEAEFSAYKLTGV